MNISTILLKIANGETLSPLEMSELRLWGNEAQSNGEYIKSLQDGTGSLSVSQISGLSGEFRYSPQGLASLVAFRADNITTATPTNASYNRSFYDDLKGYSASTTFRIPFSGKYQISLDNVWQASTGGGYRQTKIINAGYGYMEEYDAQHSSENSPLVNVIRGEASLVGGSDISIEVYQNSGLNTVDCSGRMSIRLIRNFDGDIV